MKNIAKAGWEVAPLGTVAQIRPNKKEVKSTLSDEDEVSFVPMDCLGVDQVTLAEHQTRPLREVYGGYTYFRNGDVLLAKITPCFENGKLGIADDLTNGIGFGSSEFVVLRPSEKLFAGYLYHFLNRRSFRDWAKGLMTGAVGHKRVPKELIETLEIPLPPVEEQRRIVAVLDKAFEGLARARTNAETNLTNARELFETSLSAFIDRHKDSWSSTTLGEAYDVRDGTHDSPKYHATGRALITSKNLGRDGLHFEKVKYISEEDYVSISRRSGVDKGDVLFAMIGTIGNPIVVDVEPDFAIKNVALFKMKEGRNGQFLRYLLRSKYVVEKMHAEAKGTTQQFVGLGYLRSFPVMLPEPIVESTMVDELDRIEAQCRSAEALYEIKIQDLYDLRQSLLQKAFAGELT
ncbi:MAG: restriction endonuclease subunit S [Rhodovulum sp.]|nr:restriction endonuclease subunit S [Rhodovulum sp.]